MKRIVFAAAILPILASVVNAQIIQQENRVPNGTNPVVPALSSMQMPQTRIAQTAGSQITPEGVLVEPKALFLAPNQSVQSTQASQMLLASHPQVAPTLRPAPAVPAHPARLIASEAVTKNHRLQHLTPEQFEQQLVGKLGKRFVPVQNVENSSNLARYRLPVKDGTDVELSIDRPNGVITIIGSAPMADSCLQVARLLDSREGTAEFVSVQRANLVPVKQVAQILVQESQKPGDAPKLAQNMPAFRQNDAEPAARFSPPGQATPVAGDKGGGIVGPVQIDIIDGLDTMVIRGNPKDVAAIRAMLDQIETMSLEHEPVLELVTLKQADSYRISQMVQQLYSQVYQARRGSVTMLPLIKPNTILIVGKKESVETAKELIAKLDTPVAPESEFLVVRLKNASSDALQTQLTTFYANTNRQGRGLESQVFVVSDYRTNSLIIQASPRDLTEVAAMVRQLDTPGGDAVNTVKTFSLKNAMASELATTLQNAISGTSGTGTGGFGNQGGGTTATNRSRSPMLSLGTVDADGNLLKANVLLDVRITADTRSNTLIVSAPADSMPLIEALIKQLDQLPSAESQIKVFTLVNGDASTLTTVMQNLFATSSTSGGGFGGGTTQNTSQMATVRPGIEEGESTLVSVRFQTDTRTNSIIACGSAGDMAVVEALLIRLDEENMNNRKVMVLKLVNTRASDVATVIQNYVTSERQLEIQNSSTYYPQSPREQYLKEVVVTAEDISNNLIVSTTPRYYEQIRQIVRELDERQLMVAIQVLIAEVTIDNNKERGIEIGLQDSLLFDRSILSNGALSPGFLFGDPTTGLPLGDVNPKNVGTQGITSLGVGRANSSGIGGFTFAASSESVSVLIRALEQQSKLRVLSRPHLTVMHNNKGTVSVGQRIPYVTGTDSSYGGGMQTSTDFYEVGTILDLIPRIMPDGMISMVIHAERSSVSETGGITIAVSEGVPITSPRVNQAIAETTVNAMDGQTIVFAGLITEEKETINRSVPFLNRIPVIKHFFEYESKTCKRSELLIIMTPTIIRSEADMELLRQQEASRMHWCINDVVRLAGNSAMKVRSDEWSPCEVPFIKAQPVILDDRQLPSEDKIRQMYPAPSLAPENH